jgi:3-oxoacyl-[acyl-carrier-protein] synthase-3
MNSKARITAIGSYVPAKVLSNADLEQMVHTQDEWIVQRTGIRERRIAANDEFTSDMCFKAVEDLMRRYSVSIEDVDLILVATYTPDFPAPSVACLIQSRFGIASTGALDVNAACAGFVYAVQLANGLLSSGMNRKVLVLGADTASKIIDYSDRSSCILFGDGAGAVLMERTEDEGSLLAHHFGTDGSGGIHLYRAGLSSSLSGNRLAGDGRLMQNGREVYRFAVTAVPTGVRSLLDHNGLSVDQIDWFIPHSANLRIIESLCQKTGIPLDKTLYSLEYYGNTSAATIPLTLHMGVKNGQVRAGDRLLLFGFGGGLTYGGILMNWTLPAESAESCESKSCETLIRREERA